MVPSYRNQSVDLQSKSYSDKSNHIFWKNVKDKRNVVLDSIFDFADVSSYIALKISAPKKMKYNIFWSKNAADSLESIL